MRITFEGAEHHEFRSQLEADVAAELDRHLVSWRYEVSVTLPDNSQPRYLPDFTIDHAAAELRLPEWVEVKPMAMLWELRDRLGVTRRAGEFFEDDVHVEGAGATTLKAYGDELWKPKKLAEVSGASVLVVGKVGATRSLSVEMRPSAIILSRTHPFANWLGHTKRLERERREAEWARDAERRRLEWEASRQAAVNRRRAEVASIVGRMSSRPPRFESGCFGCFERSDDGAIYRVVFADNSERWERICAACIAVAKGQG